LRPLAGENQRSLRGIEHSGLVVRLNASGPCWSRPVGLFLLFFADDFAVAVLTAIRADGVRQTLFATIAAGNQVLSSQGIVGTAAIAAARRVFAFRMRRHS
jgi:hypothetical protein